MTAAGRSAGALAIGAVLAGLLGGCGGDDTPVQQSPQLKAQLAQYREDEVAHRIRVRLTNPGQAGVTITKLALDWPGLASSAAAPDYPLGAGQEAALPMPYTKANCGADLTTATTAPSSPPKVVVTVREGNDTRQERIAPEQDEGVLARIWAADCRSQALAAATDVKFGPDWTPFTVNGLYALRGRLEITREATKEAINVVGLSGSVLLNLVALPPIHKPLLSVAPGRPKGSLPIAVYTTLRCDGHSLGESKKPYEFNVQIALGSGQPSPATVVPDTATKAKMLRTIQRGCGLPPT